MPSGLSSRAVDLESQANTVLLNVNPQGWQPGGEAANKDWQMLGGMDTRGGVVYVGDDTLGMDEETGGQVNREPWEATWAWVVYYNSSQSNAAL